MRKYSWVLLVLLLCLCCDSARGQAELPDPPLYNVTTIPLQWQVNDTSSKMHDFFYHSITGEMYVSDYTAKKIYRIDSQGIVSQVVAFPFPAADMVQSRLDPDIVFVTTASNMCMYRVNLTSAQYDVFAGTCATGSLTQTCYDGPLSNSTLCMPLGLEQDMHGNLFIADLLGHRIRMIEMDKAYLSTYAGTEKAAVVDGPRLGGAMFYVPNDLLLVQDLPQDRGGTTLFVSELENHIIRAINSTGWVSIYAGKLNGGSTTHPETDGPKFEAYFYGPRGMVMDKQFNLYVTDEYGSTIRVVTSTGFVLTVAGAYNVTTPVIDGPGANATFNAPTAIGFAPFSKDLIVLDSLNKLIRRLKRCLLFLDQDGDGYGNSSISVETCDDADIDDKEGVYVDNDLDCDDANPAVNVMVRYYLDLDGDGYGNESVSMLSCYPLPPDSPWVSDDNSKNGFDCNDNDPNVGVCPQPSTSSPVGTSTTRNSGPIIAAAVTVPLLVVLIVVAIIAAVVVVVVARNKKRTSGTTHQETDNDAHGAGVGVELPTTTTPKNTMILQPQIRINGDSFTIPYEELTIVKKLGGGAFGIVFEGLWGEIKVAIKKLLVDQTATTNIADFENFVREFENEISILGGINHRNLLTLYGACLKPPNLAIVMELMSCTLFDVIHVKKKALTWLQRLRLAKDICSGMHYLHKRGIIHRDLKTQNILLDSDDMDLAIAKICDFGLSRVADESSKGQMSQNVGTPLYMSPEVIAGRSYGPACDVYSAAIIFYELYTGLKPYAEERNKTSIPLKVLDDPNYRPVFPQENDQEDAGLTEHEVGMKQGFKSLITRSWIFEPEKRPTFEELKRELDELMSEMQPQPEPEPQPQPQPRQRQPTVARRLTMLLFNNNNNNA